MSKPANSFILFCKDNRKYLQKEHSELSNSAISSLLGKEWREMRLEQKRPYIEKANILKKVSISLNSNVQSLTKKQQFVPVQKREKQENMFNFKLTKTIKKSSKLKVIIPPQKSIISEKLESPIDGNFSLYTTYPQNCTFFISYNL